MVDSNFWVNFGEFDTFQGLDCNFSNNVNIMHISLNIGYFISNINYFMLNIDYLFNTSNINDFKDNTGYFLLT